MHAAAETAVGAGDHALAPHQTRVTKNAIGDELRMLDHVAGVTDDARNQDLARG